jgi:hypothetical protein
VDEAEKFENAVEALKNKGRVGIADLLLFRTLSICNNKPSRASSEVGNR